MTPLQSTADILKQAKALIADESNWIKSAGARDSNGAHVAPTNKSAVKFCALGAVANTCDKIGKYTGYSSVTSLLYDVNGGLDTVTFNDKHSTTHADVMALFDKAIAVAERQENEIV